MDTLKYILETGAIGLAQEKTKPAPLSENCPLGMRSAALVLDIDSGRGFMVDVVGGNGPAPDCMLIGRCRRYKNPKTQSRVTFGLFEADLKTGELWKAGYRVKL